MFLILLSAAVVAGATAMIWWYRRKTAYWNPIDSRMYVAHWRWYRPDTLHKRVGRTALQYVALLSEQDAFEREMGAHSLAALCKRIEDRVRGVVEADTGTYDLIVEVTVRPHGQPSFQLATKGQALDEELHRIHDALGAQSAVNTRGAELKFQMVFRIGGEEINSSQYPVAPRSDSDARP